MGSSENMSLSDQCAPAKEIRSRFKSTSVPNQSNPWPGVGLCRKSTHYSAMRGIGHSALVPLEGGKSGSDGRWVTGVTDNNPWGRCGKHCSRESLLTCVCRWWRSRSEVDRCKGLGIVAVPIVVVIIVLSIYNWGKGGDHQGTGSKGEEVQGSHGGCKKSRRRTADIHVESIVATD